MEAEPELTVLMVEFDQGIHQPRKGDRDIKQEGARFPGDGAVIRAASLSAPIPLVR